MRDLGVKNAAWKWPRLSLCFAFFAWKTLLLSIVVSSPGPGYDTSTSLIQSSSKDLSLERTQNTRINNFLIGHGVLTKFARWDAVYFTQIARRHYVFEQEWAFGWGFTRLLSFLEQLLKFGDFVGEADGFALAGVLVANAAHLVSVIVLYELGALVLRDLKSKAKEIAFLAACLHIVSPAGVFLVAPYAESLFSTLNFSGFYLYALSLRKQQVLVRFSDGAALVGCGLCFGLASTLRGNGLLSGLVLISECFRLILHWTAANSFIQTLPRLGLTVLSGSLMGLIAAVPQYLAFADFCLPSQRRPWCSNWFPSIYAWVQKEYWNVGFLKYWTVSNLPLFLLAAPMLSILIWTSIQAWRAPGFYSINTNKAVVKPLRRVTGNSSQDRRIDAEGEYSSITLRNLAVPQLVLGVLALTSYHVQIITRLSSGYPVWYWHLALLLKRSKTVMVFRQEIKPATWIIRWMIMYAVIQAGLFASFLPPA